VGEVQRVDDLPEPSELDAEQAPAPTELEAASPEGGEPEGGEPEGAPAVGVAEPAATNEAAEPGAPADEVTEPESSEPEAPAHEVTEPETPEAEAPEPETPEAEAPEAEAPEPETPEAEAPGAGAPEGQAEALASEPTEGEGHPATPQSEEPLAGLEDPDLGSGPRAGAFLSFFASLSLISLICVVSAVVAGISHPGLDRVRKRGSEAEAVQALREILAAQNRFRSEDLDQDGVQNFGGLAELATQGLLDPDLASGVKGGYRFQVAVSSMTPGKAWMAVAEPLQNLPSQPRFAINHLGAVRFRTWQGIPLDNQTCSLPVDAQVYFDDTRGAKK